MANSIRITYHGEVLCCLDPTEVKATEPYLFVKPQAMNVFKRLWRWLYQFLTGKRPKTEDSVRGDSGTKVLFKDGTWMRLRIPFMEFVDGYC